MPRKTHFEKNLSNVNIRTSDYEALKKLQHKNEPFYNVVRNVVNVITDEAIEMIEENNLLRDAMETWKNRALDAESKLGSIQRQLM